MERSRHVPAAAGGACRPPSVHRRRGPARHNLVARYVIHNFVALCIDFMGGDDEVMTSHGGVAIYNDRIAWRETTEGQRPTDVVRGRRAHSDRAPNSNSNSTPKNRASRRRTLARVASEDGRRLSATTELGDERTMNKRTEK